MILIWPKSQPHKMIVQNKSIWGNPVLKCTQIFPRFDYTKKIHLHLSKTKPKKLKISTAQQLLNKLNAFVRKVKL